MKKWADYLISEVRYDSENLISTAMRHQDTDLGITLGESVDRSTITSDIKNGLSYITIYNGKNSWKKGHKIQTFSIGGITYLRIDENKVKLDYLGDLPELLLVKSNPILEPEPPSSSRGSLPKESAEELPQELDLVPEPETVPEPEPEQATPEQIEKLNQLQKQIEELETVPEPEPEPEQATPEQIEKLNQLQKQIEELETVPEPEPPSSSRGSLPKESAEELPQELDLVPEPETVPEPEPEQATPEQIEKLNQLQKQIEELETVPEPEPEPEQATPEQIEKLNQLQKQIEELETVPEPEPPSSSRGSLPKESAEELPQELDLVPEPETVPEPEPEQATPEQIEKLNQLQKQIEELETVPEPEPEPEQATPEQIEKLNQLQKQIEELETVPEPEPPSSSRGSLPKESAEELPQELDLVPEPETVPEPEPKPEPEPEPEILSKKATPEQLTQLDDLQRQIDKLENMLFNPILFESKSAEGFTPGQFSKVKELEKEIKKLEGVETEYDIIQTLQKQNKKLDDIEKKLHDLEKMK